MMDYLQHQMIMLLDIKILEVIQIKDLVEEMGMEREIQEKGKVIRVKVIKEREIKEKETKEKETKEKETKEEVILVIQELIAIHKIQDKVDSQELLVEKLHLVTLSTGLQLLIEILMSTLIMIHQEVVIAKVDPIQMIILM